jgi:hypothetical protein
VPLQVALSPAALASDEMMSLYDWVRNVARGASWKSFELMSEMRIVRYSPLRSMSHDSAVTAPLNTSLSCPS